LLGQKLKKATVDPVAWPLLRIADRGQRVLAAQHLLRAAGVPGIVPDGRFTRELADAVRAFQAERGFGRDDPDLDSGDGPNGMIGGETWPALARLGRAGEGGEAQQAVEVLLRGRNEPVPDVVTPEIWQRLLAP
jgi:peptidoglycan hydrolase-like protein with peptidoglycan-binding domain